MKNMKMIFFAVFVCSLILPAFSALSAQAYVLREGEPVGPGASDETIRSGLTDESGMEIDRVAVPSSAGVLITLGADAQADSGLLNVYYKQDDGAGNLVWTHVLGTRAYIGMAGLYKEAEGDLRTPVGIFRMNTPFGVAPALEDFPENYIQVTDDLYWDGDTSSPFYNKLVSTHTYDSFDRSLSEHLIDYAGYYDYSLDTGYNPDCVPGAGSAIFLHCVVDDAPTHGCIAIPAEDMISILRLYEEGNTWIAIYDNAEPEALYADLDVSFADKIALRLGPG